MSIVLAEILEWAQDKLAYWEQLALDKIIAKQSLTFDDHNECLEYLLQDKDLRPKTEQRPKINFLQNIPTENNSANKSVHLQGISKVRNVNALVGNQHITFDKKLTVIYGKNGSGKSGYARIIGRAGFTRGDQEILRDVLANPDETATPYAQIELVDNTGQQSILEFTGDAIPAMSSFYMFDSAAIEAHLKNQNELSFSPTGLMYLKFLVEETDAIRNLLAQEIDRHKAYTPPQINWDGKTSVSDLLQSLNAQTKLDEIRSLADLTDEEQEQIVRLEQQIADIENQDSRLIINTKEQGLTDIKNLQQNHISQIMSALAESTISTLNQLIEEYHQISETISQYQLNDLKHPQLHKTGTDEWRTFADAAHKLAQTERIDYPQTGDVCLLCHQPLNLEAQKLVERLWGFHRQAHKLNTKKW